MHKPSGPSCLMLTVAIIAALMAFYERRDLSFSQGMEQMAVIAASFALSFYLTVDRRLTRQKSGQR
jgi:hypothetical protein